MNLQLFERSILAIVAIACFAALWDVRSQNDALRSSLTEAASRMRGESTILPGRPVRRIAGINERGQFVDVETSKLLLVITFNTTCEAVKTNASSWRQTLRSLPSSMPVVWATSHSFETAAAFLAEHQLPGRLVADAPFDVHAALGLSMVPQIALIEEGRVTVAWPGDAAPEAVLSEVMKTFSAVGHNKEEP